MEDFLFVLLLISACTQTALLLFLFPKLLFYKEIPAPTITRSVSVIIAARNEKENLRKLVPLLLEQDYHLFEIIIANDRSTDATQEYLNTVSDPKLRVLHFETIPEGYNSKKYVLTRAIEAAKNEILLLTDADCHPQSRQWISGIQQQFDPKTEIVLGYSPYALRPGFLNLFIRYETLLTATQYLSFALAGYPYMGVGRNMAYTRKLFEDTGGYQNIQHITGGDDDLFIGKNARKGRVKICTNKKTQVISYPKNSWKDFSRQKIRHAYAGKKYTLRNKFIAGLFPVSLLFMYFSGTFLAVGEYNITSALFILIWRSLVLIIIFALITRRLGEPIKWYWFPVLDLFYVLNYLITGTAAIFSKNVKWR